MPPTVTTLRITPVKGMRIQPVEALELGEFGARGDRAFYVVDAGGRMQNGKDFKRLQTIRAGYDPDSGVLSLTFPEGAPVAAEVAFGAQVTTSFFGQERVARELAGPFSAALSEHLGQPLRLVGGERSAVDRGRKGAVSLISQASVARLADAAGRETVDARRFRMLIELDGVAAHAEDGWVGRRLRVGEALISVLGHVGRCAITTRDPDTGETDLPTLKLLGGYRGDLETTEPIAFGVHGSVLEPGSVRVGDAVAVA
jgi:MOSC domain-containing protein